jgi:hypothetical protein
MHQNQQNCFRDLKQGIKAKGFTNGKYIIVTPYVGDAMSIFDII